MQPCLKAQRKKNSESERENQEIVNYFLISITFFSPSLIRSCSQINRMKLTILNYYLECLLCRGFLQIISLKIYHFFMGKTASFEFRSLLPMDKKI